MIFIKVALRRCETVATGQWQPQCEPQEPTDGPAEPPGTSTPEPPVMTRRTGSPVCGSVRSGASFMLWFTSKRRTGFSVLMVS